MYCVCTRVRRVALWHARADCGMSMWDCSDGMFIEVDSSLQSLLRKLYWWTTGTAVHSCTYMHASHALQFAYAHVLHACR